MEDGPNIQSKNRFQGVVLDTLWWVVFEEKPTHRFRWWDHFTHRGFRHCWAYTRHPEMSGWLAIDCQSSGTTMRFYSDEILAKHDFASLHEVIHAEGSIVLPSNAVFNDYWIPRLMPLTCVEMIRHVLGIHDRFIITPLQLYRYIVKNRLNMFEYNSMLSTMKPRRL